MLSFKSSLHDKLHLIRDYAVGRDIVKSRSHQRLNHYFLPKAAWVIMWRALNSFWYLLILLNYKAGNVGQVTGNFCLISHLRVSQCLDVYSLSNDQATVSYDSLLAGYYYQRLKSYEGRTCKPRLHKKIYHRFCKDVTPCRTVKDCTEPNDSCICDEDCGKICFDPKYGGYLSDSPFRSSTEDWKRTREAQNCGAEFGDKMKKYCHLALDSGIDFGDEIEFVPSLSLNFEKANGPNPLGVFVFPFQTTCHSLGYCFFVSR